MKICQESPHLMWDFPKVICCCIRRQDSPRLHLLQSACSARASKTEKAAIMSNPITTNMRLAIYRTSFKLLDVPLGADFTLSIANDREEND
jgi:HD-like signal output (HDOD) protein